VIFQGSDCDTDHYLITATVRKRLSVSKLLTQKSDVEKFILKKVSDLEVGNNIRLKSQKVFSFTELM